MTIKVMIPQNSYKNRPLCDSQASLRPPSVGEASSLGSIAEFSSASDFLPQTVSAEADRIAELIQREEQRWDRVFDRLNTARRLLPSERVADCQRSIAPEYLYAGIRFDPDRGRASYRNLVLCESASCPFCGTWRSEAAREELSAALAQMRRYDLFPILVTFTVRHSQDDKLTSLRAAINAAYNRVFSGRWWRAMQETYGYFGKIRVAETTYGRHGWHPHYHQLLVLDIELVGPSLEAFRLEFAAKWGESLRKQGFSATLEHGVDAKVADSEIAEYIAKYGREPAQRSWGADAEMAKAPMKKATLDGMTPLELLDAAGGQQDALARLAALLEIDDLAAARSRAGTLWREYFLAFKGRSRIHWSKGLRDRLEVPDTLAIMREAQAEKAAQSEAFDLALLDRDNWRKVVSLDRDSRAELLGIASAGDAHKLAAWFAAHGIIAMFSDLAWERSAAARAGPRAGPRSGPH